MDSPIGLLAVIGILLGMVIFASATKETKKQKKRISELPINMIASTIVAAKRLRCCIATRIAELEQDK